MDFGGARNSARLDEFLSFDLRASHQFALSRGELSAYVDIGNATSRRNPCCVEYTAEPASGGGYVLDREVGQWPGIVPSIGVLWTF